MYAIYSIVHFNQGTSVTLFMVRVEAHKYHTYIQIYTYLYLCCKHSNIFTGWLIDDYTINYICLRAHSLTQTHDIHIKRKICLYTTASSYRNVCVYSKYILYTQSVVYRDKRAHLHAMADADKHKNPHWRARTGENRKGSHTMTYITSRFTLAAAQLYGHVDDTKTKVSR